MTRTRGETSLLSFIPPLIMFFFIPPFRLLVSLRRRISSLNTQLCVLCAPLGSSNSELTNQMLADIGNSPTALEDVFKILSDGVHQLGEAATKRVECKDVDVLSVVQELRERDHERGNHDDEVTTLETKMEELNTLLADARCTCIHTFTPSLYTHPYTVTIGLICLKASLAVSNWNSN